MRCFADRALASRVIGLQIAWSLLLGRCLLLLHNRDFIDHELLYIHEQLPCDGVSSDDTVLSLGEHDLVLVPCCELPKDLPRVALAHGRHTGDDDERFQTIRLWPVRHVPEFFVFRYGLHILKVERILLDVLELAVVLEIHPRGMTFGHVDSLLAHVLQVDYGWLDVGLRLCSLGLA